MANIRKKRWEKGTLNSRHSAIRPARLGGSRGFGGGRDLPVPRIHLEGRPSETTDSSIPSGLCLCRAPKLKCGNSVNYWPASFAVAALKTWHLMSPMPLTPIREIPTSEGAPQCASQHFFPASGPLRCKRKVNGKINAERLQVNN